MSSNPDTRAAFLDRDGVINAPPPAGEYVTSPSSLQLLPGAAEAIKELHARGFFVAVVTNQRGVALGLMTEADLDAVHARMVDALAEAGAHVDAIYACVHHEGVCECRKPGTGLFDRAKQENPGLDLRRSVLFGDSWRDIEAGRRIGCRTVFVGSDGADRGSSEADHVASSLLEGVKRFASQP